MSLVQQQEAASIAKAETTSEEMMRIMEWVVVREKIQADGRYGFYLVGVT